MSIFCKFDPKEYYSKVEMDPIIGRMSTQIRETIAARFDALETDQAAIITKLRKDIEVLQAALKNQPAKPTGFSGGIGDLSLKPV